MTTSGDAGKRKSAAFIEKILRECERSTQPGVTSIEHHNALKFIKAQAEAALHAIEGEQE
jgi:hypothetical protein